MFIGHYAIGLASKKFAPDASLGALIAAPILLDLIWPIFLLLGWEQVAIGSAVFNGTDSTFRPMYTIAFDEIGSPYVFNYTNNQTNDLQDGSVVLRAGQFSTTVSVQPATGEINVN